jgi:hypothetical protein
MKTRRSGSRLGCASNQSCRRFRHRDPPVPVHGRTFLNVQPLPRSQALKALRRIETACSARRRAAISCSVMSRRSSISPTMKASCAARRETSRRPCRRAVRSPVLARAIHRIAVDIPTRTAPLSAVLTNRPSKPQNAPAKIVHLVLVPSPTSSTPMLNQAATLASHHNRFNQIRECSRTVYVTPRTVLSRREIRHRRFPRPDGYETARSLLLGDFPRNR